MKSSYACPIERNHILEANNDCFACEAYKLITSLIGILRRFGHENSALWGEKYLQEIYGSIVPCDDCGRTDGTHNMEVEH